MSLINQMLKDLAQRTFPIAGHESVLPLFSGSTRWEDQKIKIIAIVTIIASMTVGFIVQMKFYTAQHKQSFTMQKISLRPYVHELLSERAQITQALSGLPVRLSAITLQIENNTTSIRLLLSDKLLYRVNQYPDKHILQITLERTQLMAGLPTISYNNSAIKDIAMIQRGNDLIVRMKIKEDAVLKQLSLTDVKSAPEMQINFTMQQPSLAQASEESAAPSPVKKIMVDLTTKEMYQNAVTLVEKGQGMEAIAAFSDLIMKSPEYIPAYQALAGLYLQQESTFKASRVIDVGLQHRPFYPPLVEMKARILVAEGKYSKALHLLTRVMPSLNQNPDYHALIAVIYQHEGKPELAASLYQQLLVLHPDNANWWAGLGIAMDSLGQGNEAQNALKRAFNSENLNPELRAYIGSRLENTSL